MRVLVNALSIGSLSGRHVLYGHLRQLAAWDGGKHEFVVLSHAQEPQSAELKLPNIEWISAPPLSTRWLTRSLWEAVVLPRWMRRLRIERYFTPNGTILMRSPVPQVSLAQNPWPLVRAIHRSSTERWKAQVQRAAFRRAYLRADVMTYNSHHMQDLYCQNAGGRNAGGRGVIAYQGINDDTFKTAETMRGTSERLPLTIVSVSAMAHWKCAETLVRAVKILHDQGVRAHLRFVGPWPDLGYEQQVRRLAFAEKVESHIIYTGQVPVTQLMQEYAQARVFCLMSRCESFGIPAVEAQAFGTPVVGSTACAMPEIGGNGGVYGSPDSPAETADLLKPLLTDEQAWRDRSAKALENAERFRWSRCTVPLAEALLRPL